MAKVIAVKSTDEVIIGAVGINQVSDGMYHIFIDANQKYLEFSYRISDNNTAIFLDQ